jgi:hypothetical protein
VISPDTAVRRLTKEVAAAVQPFGFQGFGSTWRLVNGDGAAAVGRWRVTNPDGRSSGVIVVGLTIAVSPAPWWEYTNWRRARRGELPIPIEEAPDRASIRLHPEHTDLPVPTHCRLHPDPSAHPYRAVLPADVDHARALLSAGAAAKATRAIALLAPGRYVDELIERPDKGSGDWEPIVVLLAERGPSAELDDAIGALRDAYAERGNETAELIVGYARERAASGAPPR